MATTLVKRRNGLPTRRFSAVPPPKLVRLVERARHYLLRVHQRTVPPYAAMTEMIMNAWAAQAITAVDLGIADALADGPLGAEDLAARVNADVDALRRLLRVLVGRGIFRQRRSGAGRCACGIGG